MPMPTLEARMQAIEDRFALLDLEADYAYGWDFGSPQEWAEVFAEDGSFEMLPAGNTPHARVLGRAGLEAFCSQIRQTWSGLHYMHPPRLKIAGDRADSMIFFEFRHIMQTGMALIRQGVTAGYYRTTYVRTAQGWRIQERIEQAIGEELSNFYPSSLSVPQP